MFCLINNHYAKITLKLTSYNIRSVQKKEHILNNNKFAAFTQFNLIVINWFNQKNSSILIFFRIKTNFKFIVI